MTLVIYVEGNQVPPQASVKVDLETVGQIFNRNMPVEDGMIPYRTNCMAVFLYSSIYSTLMQITRAVNSLVLY